jgi:hypothetical protein
MKAIHYFLSLAICCSIISVNTSCVVKKDNGKHKGWFKNSNNPHHPASTNPGKGNGNGNGKGNSGKKGK